MLKNKIIRHRLFILLVMIGLSSASFASPKSDFVSENFNIEQYRGKVVYLDFWASWCVPCRKSFPWMNQLHNKYSSDEFIIIAVNLDKQRNLADEFLNKNPAQFMVHYDPEGLLPKQYKIKGMPSSIIFNKHGKIISRHTGFFEQKIKKYEQAIKAAF